MTQSLVCLRTVNSPRQVYYWINCQRRECIFLMLMHNSLKWYSDLFIYYIILNYRQANLFKQISAGAVMGSKSFKVSWEKETNATVDSKNHRFWQVSKTTKLRSDFLTFFKLAQRNKTPIVLSLKQSHALFKTTMQAVLKDSVSKFSDNCYLQCKIRQCQQDSYSTPSTTDWGSSKFLKWQEMTVQHLLKEN